MVQIVHCGENNLKINSILEAAQKRFGLYGLEKTTMREIAKDVGISKASLYYYFPDKEHIYKMVVELEQEVFFDLIKKNMEQTTDPELMIKHFVDVRLNYFKTFFNLTRLRHNEFRSMKKIILEDTLSKFKTREAQTLEVILQQGVEKKIFFTDNTLRTATLFLEALKGLSSLMFHQKELMYVEQEDYDILIGKIHFLTEMFIKSLKYKEN
jgi:AcrR family transcriptional regulator